MPSLNRISQAEWAAWPPTQMHLQPGLEQEDAHLDKLDHEMDHDPITYFLTPSSPYEDEMEEMDFDAGIEDSQHPSPIIRSVSPSSLKGLRLGLPRPPTPPRTPSTPDLDIDTATPNDDDDDNEDYIHFPTESTPNYSLPFGMRESGTTKSKSHHPLTQMTRPGPRPLTGSHVARSWPHPARQSPHSWREPSPDVWSIEEEYEEKRRDSTRGSGWEGNVEQAQRGKMVRAKTIDVPAAKPKKRVRFVLPG